MIYMENEKKHKLIAIDGNSLLYRAFFAMKYLSTADGQPTNAVYGFIMMLFRILNEEKPDSIVVAWDTPVKTFRHKAYDGYKAQRKPTPDELLSQAPIVRGVVKAFRIPVIELEGYEADDVVATIARQSCEEGYNTVIVTGDLDALQLVNDCVSVMTTIKGVTDTVVYDPQAVIDRYGIPPESMADFKALKGDPSDNIPGISGIGDKKAAALVQQFGSVENMLEHLDEIMDVKVKATLQADPEEVIRSKRLVKLIEDAPIDFHVRDCKVQEPDWDELRELFVKLEFKTLLKRLPSPMETEAEEERPEAKPLGCSQVVTSREELNQLVDRLSNTGNFAIQVQVTDMKPAQAELLGLTFSTGTDQTYYVPLTAKSPEVTGTFDFDSPETFNADLSAFAKVLENPKIKKVGHDLKICYGVLKSRGIEIAGLVFDTMIGAYVLNPTRASYKLTDLALEQLGLELPQIDPKARNVESTSSEIVLCAETETAYRLAPVLKARLEQDKLTDLFNQIEMPLVSVLAEMELRGVAVDPTVLGELSEKLEKRIVETEKEIFDLAGLEFNIGSTKQLQEVLYDKLGIPTTKKTKTGYSTDADTLAQLAPMYPIVDKILLYRELTKIKSTYADALPRLINSRTGKIHTSLNQSVTATGRLSSSDPNLQNIPIRTEIGREIRKAFIASNNNLLLSADYSQIELRILAHVTRDPALMEAFLQDEDIHTATAGTLFNVPLSAVTPEMRRQAKTVNFAVIYGMSDYGLARELQIPTHVAREFITNYFAGFPGVKTYTEETLKLAREHGYVSTLLGRRRYIPEINSPNRNFRLFAERAAVNMPIQGTAADIMKIAMIHTHERLSEMRVQTQMVLQVHDELVFEVPPNELDLVAPVIRSAMEQAMSLDVPLKVDVKAGKNWCETEIVREEEPQMSFIDGS